MKPYNLVVCLLLVLILVISPSFASEILNNESAEQRDAKPIPNENTFILRLETIDRTAGQSLPQDDLQKINNEIISRIRTEYPAIKIISKETERANAILRVFIDVFTAGNRALRFWVGFGAGKAHMKITTEWLDEDSSEPSDSKQYQRFGAASLRSGETIERQMTELIGQYSAEFVSLHITQ